MEKLAVVQGAILKCNRGTSPSPLTVTIPSLTHIEGSSVATIMDHLPGANIKPFGVCAVTGGPCVPVTPLPWFLGEPSIPLVPSQFPILSKASLLPCAVGGIIQVLFPGQTTVFVDSRTQPLTGAEKDLLAKAIQAAGMIADLLAFFGSLPKGEGADDYYKPKFDGDLAGGSFDLFAWNLGGRSENFSKLSPGLSIGPNMEGYFLREKISMKTPGRFNSFLPMSFSNIPFVNSDVNTDLTATGPSANASAGIHNKSLGAGAGISLASAKLEQRRKLPLVGNASVDAEVGLKLEVGFSIGKKTKVKLPFVSFGFGIG